MRPGDDRAPRCRGALEREEPGARGLERLARNPECRRLFALTAAGVSPRTAAARIYREPPTGGESPFALAQGTAFEHRVLGPAGAGLAQLYAARTQLPRRPGDVRDLSARWSAGRHLAPEQRLQATREVVAGKLAGATPAPALVVKPLLEVQLVGVPCRIEPDALVASEADALYRVVEIKAYEDRGGQTSAADLRSACRQAAVGVVALRQAVAQLGVGKPADLVPATADLVLRAPRGFAPRLHTMSIEAEVASLERLSGDWAAAAADLERLLPPGTALDDPAVLEAVPTRYRLACQEHCALAPHCRAAAVGAGDPALLGETVVEQLGAVGSLTRALELLSGAGTPRSADERRGAERLQALARAYREVLTDAG